jgi:hypothetical protein
MRKNNPRSVLLPVVGLGLASLLSACGGGGASDSTSSTGKMTLAVTDAPVDSAREVIVQFSGVALKPADGQELVFDLGGARTIDLLALQGGASSALLDGQSLPAGEYEWMRLMVDAQTNTLDSYITFETGEQYSLFIPSGAETGLKLVSPFTVPVNGSASFTIDFDLRKSVVAPPGQEGDYFLRPALRVVDNSQVGGIAGSVSMATLGDVSCPSADPEQNGNVVYVFSGAEVTPSDIDGGEVDPISSANVELNAEGAYTYKAAFLTAGDYTVAFTCQAKNDDPEAADELVFLGTTNASVTADTTTTINF